MFPTGSMYRTIVHVDNFKVSDSIIQEAFKGDIALINSNAVGVRYCLRCHTRAERTP